ncbi:MAG: tail fiber domain-containing protein, partial [Bacteroidia bacterium]
AILLSAQLTSGQWKQANPANGQVIFFDPNSPFGNQTAVGIGDFTSTNPSAALHVNTNLTTAQTGTGKFNPGETFCTDAPNASSTDDQYWRMYHGGSEKFNIHNLHDNANIWLGSISTGDLYFFTAGNTNTRMTIVGSGNTGYVGIGQTSPTSVLHIDGTGTPTQTGGVFQTNGKSATATNWKMSQSGQGETFRIENAASSNNVALGTIASGRFDIFTNGTGNPRVSVTSGGNVGIGTTTPTSILGIDGNNGAQIIQMERRTTSNTVGNDLTILAGGATSAATNRAGGDLLLYSGMSTGSGSSKMLFYTSTANAGGSATADNTHTSKMIILGSGLVGIGPAFAAPVSRLHLHQGATDEWFQMTNTTTDKTSGDGLKIGVEAANSDVHIMQQENANMFFWTNATTTPGAATKRMQIHSTGEVGVNTTGSLAMFNVDNDPYTTLHEPAVYIKSLPTGNYNANGIMVKDKHVGNGYTSRGLDIENTTANNITGYTYGVNVTSTNSASCTSNYGVTTSLGTSPPSLTSTPHNAGYVVGIAGSGGDYNLGAGIAIGGSSLGAEGIRCEVSGATGANSVSRGGGFYSNGNSTTINYGVDIITNGTGTNHYGVSAVVTGGSATSYGVYTTSAGSSTATTSVCGVYSGASGGQYNYAIQANAAGSGGSTSNGVLAFAGGAVDNNYGLNTIVSGSTGTTNYGVKAEVSTTNATTNYGAYIATTGSSTNDIGVDAIAYGATGMNSINVGVRGCGGLSPTAFLGANLGGHFEATGGNAFTYGVFASGPTGNCTSTSSAACPGGAAFFDGNVVVMGTFQGSDSKLKTNVTDVTNAIGIINQLQPKTFNFDTAQYNFMHLEGDLQYGLIAQQLQPVLPQCVRPFGRPAQVDTSGNLLHPQVDFLAVNYTMLIPILIAGMKEQQLQINDLAAQVLALQNGNKTMPSTEPTGQLKVKLSDNTVVLEQNNPNPFKENTTISFNIPTDVKNAQILFYNSKGNVISTVDIVERGAGSLMVYGSDLTSGIYTYTLLVDGKVNETKKMMKIK